jgi:hypothetical protein
MKDVLWALVASEKLGEEPLPAAHYRERLDAFEADPLELKRVGCRPKLLAKLEEMKERQPGPGRGPAGVAARRAGRPIR